MKKQFLTIIILLCVLGTTAQTVNNKTLLWQISGPGIKSPSYIFGTIHLMCPGDIIVSDVLKEKFNSTQQLFLEIKMDDPSVMLKTMQGIRMKNDTTLQDLLPASQYDSLKNNFQKITGMPLLMMASFKPELTESFIYPSLLGCEGAEAWEQKFVTLAKANNDSVKGLETIEDQLHIFDVIPYKVQATELAETVNNIDSVKQSFNEMLRLYKEKNLDSLNSMMSDDEDKNDSAYNDLLLTNRNQKWIPEIIEQAKLKPTFFAVGAGHLGGENGVLNLLRKKGYSITPVTY